MKNMVLLIDTNIILDVFQNREDHYKHSVEVLDLVKTNKAKGYIAAHSITNLWYILRKTHTDEQRRQIVKAILVYFDIASLDKQKISAALERDNFKDFEDCLQDECGCEINADYIVTRNEKDFTTSKIPALNPEEFCKKILSESDANPKLKKDKT